jgi:hypothetical protein
MAMSTAPGYGLPITQPLDAREVTTRWWRRWRPPAHAWLALAAALIVVGVSSHPDEVAAAATHACTIGTPAGTSCGEALARLGYP